MRPLDIAHQARVVGLFYILSSLLFERKASSSVHSSAIPIVQAENKQGVPFSIFLVVFSLLLLKKA